MNSINKICLLGFGEVGSLLAVDLTAHSAIKLVAYDTLFSDPDSAPMTAVKQLSVVEIAASAEVAAADCDLVISAVTAAQNMAAATVIIPGLKPEAVFLDLNSVSPANKLAVARTVEAAGSRYVEAAVMSPIGNQRISAPILVGGPHAEEFVAVGQALGFKGMRFCSNQIGKAAATKMCRSVIIKGVESLLIESLLTARHYGIEDAVLASFNDLFPQPDWPEHARYMISRSLEHGKRRAEEMREVAITVSDAGIEPLMSLACAQRQEWTAQYSAALKNDTLTTMLDAVTASQDYKNTSGEI